ncbi:ligase-associated DNA damage response endonuclease PdeM [Sinisalibacter lacisalsi]|uniref:Metallophosphoesterase n=1 Tax=Sinisalibacter lacisalsi TaxID=1526570 RepID=A0ABQ1QTM0_9RHOB|nr:ligase-associated DNA damage response endonuclease PdeM [Sinisalibacter lacisalsi]GGD45565.1 metallophosphoesterase [Sinisalibacter lacisalsi]
MNAYSFTLCGASLALLPSGALFWGDEGLLCVSDLHLGRSERFARNAGALLPPYETRDTLTRLEADIEATGANCIVCLGDSFDDAAAAKGLDAEARNWLTRLMAGRDWVWIEGNHDPGPLDLGGTHRAELHRGLLTFRHIAEPGALGEISGHYHPKARLSAGGRGGARPCLLVDHARAILPAYGTYTGGLRSDDAVLATLMGPGALAVLIGPVPRPIPMPR